MIFVRVDDAALLDLLNSWSGDLAVEWRRWCIDNPGATVEEAKVRDSWKKFELVDDLIKLLKKGGE